MGPNVTVSVESPIDGDEEERRARLLCTWDPRSAGAHLYRAACTPNPEP